MTDPLENLSRADLVQLNRAMREYTQDQLPNNEQIRYDVNWLVGLVMRLDAAIKNLKERA